MADNKINEMLSEAASKFKGMIDANSVVGEPIMTQDGTMIVPISKVSFGFGGGGSEFDSKTNSTGTHFGGGMGGGASVNAEAFLVINNGNVRLVPMGSGSSPVDKIVDMVPGMIDKVNGFITSHNEKKAAKKEEVAGEEYDNN